MARISIEESFWFDPRIKALGKKLGCEDKAIGVVIRFWRLAQEYWKKNKLIPESSFKLAELPDALFDVELAEKRADGIYAKGSKTHFEWYSQKLYTASEAGKASAAARKRKNGSAIPFGAKNAPAMDKIDLTERYRTNPERSSSSSSSSSSSKKKKNTNIYRSNSPNSSFDQHSDLFDLEFAYKQYPRKIGKTKGLVKLKKQVRSKEDYNSLLSAIKNYSQHCRGKDPEYIKHFSTFCNEWKDWVDASHLNTVISNKKTPIDFGDDFDFSTESSCSEA